jgi:hypothetical protein
VTWKPDYLTVGEYKAYARLTDTLDDAEIAIYITAASRAIDRHTHRQFGKVAAELRYYDAWYHYDRGQWVVTIDDLMDLTGVAITIGGVALTGYTLEPRNAAAEGRPYTRLVVPQSSSVSPEGTAGEVGFTAPWGWSAVPVPVTSACRLQVNRFAARRDSPYGIAGSPSDGSELRLLAKLDPDVAVSLSDYVRPRSVK